MEIGHIIAELRKQKRWTQSDLAEKLSVTKGAVALWETGKRTPPIDKIITMADIFNVSTEFLLGRISKKESAASTTASSSPSQTFSEITAMLLRNFEKLCKEDQIYILGKTIELVREQKKAEADAPALKKAN